MRGTLARPTTTYCPPCDAARRRDSLRGTDERHAGDGLLGDRERRHRGLLEATLSVESAGVVQARPARLRDRDGAHIGSRAERLLFVTSNGWDATGAAAFGMRVAWCNRAKRAGRNVRSSAGVDDRVAPAEIARAASSQARHERRTRPRLFHRRLDAVAQSRRAQIRSGAKNAVPDDGVIRVFREKRRASHVTLVHGLSRERNRRDRERAAPPVRHGRHDEKRRSSNCKAIIATQSSRTSPSASGA